jgi:aquaporin Z
VSVETRPTRPTPHEWIDDHAQLRDAAVQEAQTGLHWRIWGAEAVGTALLVFGALSAVCLDYGDGSPVVRVLPSHSARLLLTGLLVGLCVGVTAVSPLGRISGAHINPAVTIAFRSMGHMSNSDLVGYLGAQFFGAIGGAAALRLIWGDVALSVGGGVTLPTVPTPLAFVLEAAMTATLVAAIFWFLSNERFARWTPLMLVPLLALLIWAGSDATGTSLNPARSAGPALAFTNFDALWLYFLAPITGALAVSVAWSRPGCGRRPMTAKLFHVPAYPCSMETRLPAMAATASNSAPAASASCRSQSRSSVLPSSEAGG